MSINSERNVTNQSFKGKISEIISILSGETYTPTSAANDTEMLNCKTFEYYMDILKENISSGGGGGGADDFVVNFTITTPNGATSTTTFEQIKAAYKQGKNIKGIGTISEMGNLILYPTQITDTDIVFFGFIELAAGEGVSCTLRGNSSGYSFYTYN